MLKRRQNGQNSSQSYGNRFQRSHTDSEHAECGGVSVRRSDHVNHRSPILTNHPWQHISNISNGHISVIFQPTVTQLRTVTQHDFRHILSEKQVNQLVRFRENKMAAQNFKKSFFTEVVEVHHSNLAG
jgi:hypothetical protein